MEASILEYLASFFLDVADRLSPFMTIDLWVRVKYPNIFPVSLSFTRYVMDNLPVAKLTALLRMKSSISGFFGDEKVASLCSITSLPPISIRSSIFTTTGDI